MNVGEKVKYNKNMINGISKMGSTFFGCYYKFEFLSAWKFTIHFSIYSSLSVILAFIFYWITLNDITVRNNKRRKLIRKKKNLIPMTAEKPPNLMNRHLSSKCCSWNWDEKTLMLTFNLSAWIVVIGWISFAISHSIIA